MNSEIKRMSADEYQDHMDALAKKIGRVLEGERVEDGIIACAAVAAFGLIQIAPDKRGGIRGHIDQMIEDIVAEADARKKPEDVHLGNMAKINLIMALLADGTLNRDQCKERLIAECSVADHNLDMLLNAYDPESEQLMPDDMKKVPTKFWQSMSHDEFKKIAETGWLNSIQCARLWRMTERNTPPPKKLQVFIKREDVEKLLK